MNDFEKSNLKFPRPDPENFCLDASPLYSPVGIHERVLGRLFEKIESVHFEKC